MNKIQENLVLILTEENQIIDKIEKILGGKGYKIKSFSQIQDAKQELQTKLYHLAIIGKPADIENPFEALKQTVMASPMTSLILISDATKKEIHDLAEGYGILGHISSSIPEEELLKLVHKFEQLQAALAGDQTL